MFNVGGGELIVIALIALVVLGPTRLPEAARQAGKVMADLRRISSGFQNEVKSAFDEVQREHEPKQDVVPPALGGPGSTAADLAAAIASVGSQLPPETLDPEAAPSKRTPAKQAVAKKTAAKKTASKKAAAKKAPTSSKTASATKKAAVKAAPAQQAPAKKTAAAKRAPAKKAAR